jgi:hypothetical protein
MMEALRSPETSVLTTATWSNIQEDAILHSQHSEYLKSSIFKILMKKLQLCQPKRGVNGFF